MAKEKKKQRSGGKKKLKSGRIIDYYQEGAGVAGTTDDARRKDSPYYLVKLGRPRWKRKYKTGDEIWEAAKSYFDTVDSSPMKEVKVFGTGMMKTLDLQIPYTLSGLCAHIGLDEQNFINYRKLDAKEDATEEEKDLAMVCRHIRNIIYTQKIEGASTGKFNHQIVALELGLAAKAKVETISHNSSEISSAEIKKFNNELEDEY